MFLTRFKKSRLIFRESAASVGDYVTTRALLIYEGSADEFDGFEITADDVTDFYNKTVEFRNTGQRTKLFVDHSSVHEDGAYNHQDVVGICIGPLTLGTITEADLPNPAMTDLIGRLGIFDNITITDPELVAEYKAGTAKEISVGLDIGGTFGVKNAIFEVSIVAHPRAMGAALFTKRLEAALKFGALTIAELKEEQEKAKEIDQAIFGNYWEFLEVVNNIRERASDDDLPEGETEQSLLQAVYDEFTAAIREGLGLDSQETLSKKGLVSMTDFLIAQENGSVVFDYQAFSEADLGDDIGKFKVELGKQFRRVQKNAVPDETKLENIRLKKEIADQKVFNDTFSKAVELRNAGKLPPVVFEKLFGKKDLSNDERFATFSKQLLSDDSDPIKLIVDVFEAMPSLGTFSTIEHEEIDQPEDDDEAAKAKDNVESYRKRNKAKTLSL